MSVYQTLCVVIKLGIPHQRKQERKKRVIQPLSVSSRDCQTNSYCRPHKGVLELIEDVRAIGQMVFDTACSTAATVLPFTALLPPASSAAAHRVAKTKTLRSLGDILKDSGLSTTLSPFQGVSLFRAQSRLVLHEASKSLYGGDLGCLVGN